MLLFSHSHEICSTQGIQDMVRSLSLLPVSARLKTEIYVPAGQAADCLEFLAVLKVLQYATSEVRVPKTLTFKMRLDAQSFLWKWVLLALLITYPRFETEAQGNSEIDNYRYCLSWSSGSLWLCWPIRVRCFFLISRASVSSRYSSSSSFRCLPRPLPLWLPCLSIVTSL